MAKTFGCLLLLQALAIFVSFCQAKVVTYNWTLGWVNANPDGLFEREVIGINGQWPLPVVEVDKGDQIVAYVHNGLGDKNATIHWHGMYQNGTNEMDGASMTNQCPIPPGYDFAYNFTVNQNGTYWYHCHVDYCYPDGYRQALIVHDPDAYFYDEIYEDVTITMSDWYHEVTSEIHPQFQSTYNPSGAEPLPQSFLFNDTQNTSIPVEPGKTYLLRLINIGAFVGQYFYIENHTLTIVEIDGVYTEPTPAEVLYIAVAQRYAVLVTMKNETDTNYPIVTVADSVLLDVIPSNLQLNLTNWLQYDASAPHVQAIPPVAMAQDLNPFDDMKLVPYDHEPLLEAPDHIVNVTVSFQILDNGIDYAFLNNITYQAPQVPSLYTVYSSSNLSQNQAIYGDNTNAMVLKHNDVVEIVLNNQDTGTHPFHLHGHNFQMLDRYPSYGPHFYDYKDGDVSVTYDPNNHTAFPVAPPRRDTFVVAPQGYWVARFRADNPGTWLFHCHIDWHLSQGLGLVMVEAPELLQAQRDRVPQQHWDTCKAAGIAYEGNAAGNTVDLLDLQGEIKQAGPLPPGMTSRGIVALVFSCVSAFFGMAMISIYGIKEPVAKKHTTVEMTDVSGNVVDDRGVDKGVEQLKGPSAFGEGPSTRVVESREIDDE